MGVWLLVAGQQEGSAARMCCKFCGGLFGSRALVGFWGVCVHGPVKGEGMSMLMGHMCCHVQQYILPWASIR